jgi:hypothetical protein
VAPRLLLNGESRLALLQYVHQQHASRIWIISGISGWSPDADAAQLTVTGIAGGMSWHAVMDAQTNKQTPCCDVLKFPAL